MEQTPVAQDLADVTISPNYRHIHAKSEKSNGRRAYSDEFSRLLVRLGGAEHRLDLAGAIRLREDLDRAIKHAALSDDDYLSLCG